MEESWYKFLTLNGRSPVAQYQYSLPQGDQPGFWHQLKDDERLSPGYCGFHLTNAQNLRFWLEDRLFLVEAMPVHVSLSTQYGIADSAVARRVRLVRELYWSMSLAEAWIIDCLQHTMSITGFLPQSEAENFLRNLEAWKLEPERYVYYYENHFIVPGYRDSLYEIQHGLYRLHSLRTRLGSRSNHYWAIARSMMTNLSDELVRRFSDTSIEYHQEHRWWGKHLIDLCDPKEEVTDESAL